MLRLGWGVPGSRCHGATHARDPPPFLGAGAGGERAQGCCRKLLLRGLCRNWGETQRFHHLLLGSRWGAGPRDAAGGGCGPGPLSCHTSVTMQRRPWEQCLERSHGPSWAQTQHCPLGTPCAPWREAGLQVPTRGREQLPRVSTSPCAGEGVALGGKQRAPSSRARVLWEAVSTRQRLHLGVLLALWVLRGGG